jgi:hypothetical protein
MARHAILVSALALLLASCSGAHPSNADCAAQAHGTLPHGPLRWGYYPGYGCGPVPPAQTTFS